MKLSDYVVEFIKNKVADSIFLLSGGGIMHLVDSLGKAENLNVICCHHEQAAVIAAEGYSRVKNNLGVALVTTGPGGTNAVTGVAGAWLDSIPLLVLAGQVKRDNLLPRQDGQPLIRALGFQELNVADIMKPITKYSVTVMQPEEIKYHLEKAIYLARNGRPGPVFVEIPLDVQAMDIEENNLRQFKPEVENRKIQIADIQEVVTRLKQAKRPLLVAGNGIRLAGGEQALWQFLEKTQINVVTPIFTADDLVTYEYKNYLGRQGMPGNKTANQAVDNCDLLLVVGERMQLTQTSYDYDKFATQAFKIMVDIDAGEMAKKTFRPDLAIVGDAKEFLEELNRQEISLANWPMAVETIKPEEFKPRDGYVNVYTFFQELNRQIKGFNVATANGNASLNSHQALVIERGERFITNAGLGHMGSGLPMAIGAVYADTSRQAICLEGDGSLMLNIHELQTVLHHKMPIKLFIFNNNGYCSIRNTHRKFFEKIFAADPSCGVTLPDYAKLIPAWGLPYFRISDNNDLGKINEVLRQKGPVVCELMIDPDQPVIERWEAGKFK
ncbi:MAG TPA: thiamine pyrophosphate-binding protein [Candidatus Pacearchaeota archaeon]|nr:thiamine pyrophosphate-binding protein [Candidatus Pacearchaeota archaeon]